MFPAPSLTTLPEWQGLVLGALLLLGGACWTVATLTEFKYVEDFWKVLRAGLLMLILGWLAYVFCALNMRPEWVVPWWLGLTHAVAYSGGFYLSMLHQWRLKGFPLWVLSFAETCSPIYHRACSLAAKPFTKIEKWFGSHPISCEERRREQKSTAALNDQRGVADVD